MFDVFTKFLDLSSLCVVEGASGKVHVWPQLLHRTPDSCLGVDNSRRHVAAAQQRADWTALNTCAHYTITQFHTVLLAYTVSDSYQELPDQGTVYLRLVYAAVGLSVCLSVCLYAIYCDASSR